MLAGFDRKAVFCLVLVRKSQKKSADSKELGVTISIGVSFNKIFAKLGSDMKKPDAITVITRENFKEKVWPLPVAELLYVGRSVGED